MLSWWLSVRSGSWEDGGHHRLHRLAAKAPISSCIAGVLQRTHPIKFLHGKVPPPCFHGDSSHYSGELSGDLWWHASDGACVYCFCFSVDPCGSLDALITDNGETKQELITYQTSVLIHSGLNRLKPILIKSDQTKMINPLIIGLTKG